MTTTAPESCLQANVFHARSPESVDAGAINARVDRDAFAAVRGIFSPDEMAEALRSVRAGFRPELDQPAIGEAPAAVMRNFQKLAIGGAGNHWDYRPRFMRTIYNPLWEPDIYGMHAVFRRLAQVRNVLQQKPLNHAIDTIEDGLWTAARLQHYPAGGGNISRHRDAVISTVTGDAGVARFHQLLLLITSKGSDFTEGGAFCEAGGQTYDLESEFRAGDIVIYDGTTMHGCWDVDPHVTPRLDTLDGRLVALVSLYKDMSADARAYEGYEDCDVDAGAPVDEV
ncbi:hypothetical protein GF314_17335 [bacterium]|nr:hypothetical protein [bacterium]